MVPRERAWHSKRPRHAVRDYCSATAARHRGQSRLQRQLWSVPPKKEGPDQWSGPSGIGLV